MDVSHPRKLVEYECSGADCFLDLHSGKHVSIPYVMEYIADSVVFRCHPRDMYEDSFAIFIGVVGKYAGKQCILPIERIKKLKELESKKHYMPIFYKGENEDE